MEFATFLKRQILTVAGIVLGLAMYCLVEKVTETTSKALLGEDLYQCTEYGTCHEGNEFPERKNAQ